MDTPSPDEYERRVIDALRAVREISGMDQYALAAAAGLGRNQVGRIERRERHANVATLVKLLDAMQRAAPRRTNIVTLYDLFAMAEGKIALSVDARSK